MIKERYCSRELSKLLREKGFDEPCLSAWVLDDDLPFRFKSSIHQNCLESNEYLCPTHQMAMDWLREIHSIFIEIYRSIDLNGNYHYSYNVLDSGCKYLRKGYTSFDWRYKDAVEAALEYCLTELMKGGED